MRIFSLLALVIVLAIVIMQYRGSIAPHRQNQDSDGGNTAERVEKQVNKAVSDYQKKLEEAAEQSGAAND